MHISYLARNAPFHAAGVPYLAILASSSFACALGYDRRSKQYWSTQFLLGAKIRIPQRRAHLRASTIIEGPLITIREGCRIAWCPDVSTGGLFSDYGCGRNAERCPCLDGQQGCRPSITSGEPKARLAPM